jgi:hypothetical protein
MDLPGELIGGSHLGFEGHLEPPHHFDRVGSLSLLL